MLNFKGRNVQLMVVRNQIKMCYSGPDGLWYCFTLTHVLRSTQEWLSHMQHLSISSSVRTHSWRPVPQGCWRDGWCLCLLLGWRSRCRNTTLTRYLHCSPRLRLSPCSTKHKTDQIAHNIRLHTMSTFRKFTHHHSHKNIQVISTWINENTQMFVLYFNIWMAVVPV